MATKRQEQNEKNKELELNVEQEQEQSVEIADTVKVGPNILLIVDGQEFQCAASDLDVDVADASDDELRAALARHFDLAETKISSLTVSRPDTGTILVSPRATFGG